METLKLILRPLIVISVLLLVLAGIAVGVGRALSTTLLTYEANFKDDIELYAYDMDHGLSANLSHNPTSYDTDAAWSPDGERMAFLSWRGGARQLYLLTLSPYSVRQLGEYEVYGNAYPVWSPDGTRIVYDVLYRGRVKLYIVNITAPLVEGENPRVLVDALPLSRYPAWSPDGTVISFTGGDLNETEIFTIRPDGSDLVNLTNHPGTDIWASWSPDGMQIVFLSMRESGSYVPVIMDSDGSNVRILPSPSWIEYTNGYVGMPLWSPDGTVIAVTVTDMGGAMTVYWNLDGTAPTYPFGGDTVPELHLWLPDRLLMTGFYNLNTFRVLQLTPDGDQRVLLENASYPVRWR